MKETTAEPKLLVGFAVTLVVLVVAASMMYHSLRSYVDSSDWVEHTYQVLEEIHQIMAHTTNIETNLRGYIITGDEKFLAKNHEDRTLIYMGMKQLKTMLDDNPVQQENLARFEPLLNSRLDMLEYETGLRHDQGIEVARNLLKEGKPTALMAALAREANVMTQEERKLLRERAQMEDNQAARTFWVAGSLAILVLISLIVLAQLMWREVQRRAKSEKKLMESARHDQTHSQILRLFNSSFDMASVLTNMLKTLASNHIFPVSAIYLHDEWSGLYRVVATHAAPAGFCEEFRLGEGIIGEAVRQNRIMALGEVDETINMTLEVGLFSLRPNVIICPINYQDKCIGVLALAAQQQIGASDQQFLERLTTQIGVALNNLRQYNDLKQLSEQLRLSSEAINEKNHQLEEVNRLKSEFLANMSHELRTPLNAIIGFSEVMRDGLTGQMTERQCNYANEIFTSGEHLLSLINDVLDLSKIESGAMTIDFAPVGLSSLVGNSLSVIKEEAFNRNIQLVYDCEHDVAPIQADALKLKQILYNLLSNALKFTPDNGNISVAVRTVERSAVFSRTEDYANNRQVVMPPDKYSQFVEISITDSGIGIDEDQLARLFEPFVQANSSLTRTQGGTGLGLVMVRRLAEMHDGGLAVATEMGKGSRFVVWLPVRSAQDTKYPEAGSSEVALATYTGNYNGNVLVVEDEDAASELIKIYLEEAGMTMHRVRTAEEAVTILEHSRPSLIVLDILLPDMNGWDFLAKIKQQDNVRDIPVVVVSIVADSRKGMAMGASVVLQKPITRDEFLRGLANIGFNGWQGAKPTVLVVDDDPRAVEIIASYLSETPCIVVRAHGGAEGIKSLQNQRPDLIILDLLMPEISGFEMMDIIRADPATANIPIIVVTSKMLTQEERRLLNLHVMQIIEKSEFSASNFVNEVKRALVGRTDGGTSQKGET